MKLFCGLRERGWLLNLSLEHGECGLRAGSSGLRATASGVHADSRGAGAISLETPMACAVAAMARNANIFEAVFSSK